MRILITDPCYLLTQEEWGRLNFDGDFELEIIGKLMEYSLMVSVEQTGYGDWINGIRSLDSRFRIIEREFCADSGMVCVVIMSDYLYQRVKSHCNQDLGAIIECDNSIELSKLSFIMDRSNIHWTIIEINYDGKLVCQSLRYEDYE